MHRPISIATLIVLLVPSCSKADATTTIDHWFATTRTLVDEDRPTNDVLQIDPNADCELVDGIEISGKPLELFGAATARFGDVGDRYQCAWSGDANASANVRLEVVTIDEQADFDDYANLVPTRDGNTVVPTEIGDVQVASFRPDPTTPPLTTSILVDPTHRGGVHLVVELLDPDTTFTPTDHALLLESLASNG